MKNFIFIYLSILLYACSGSDDSTPDPIPPPVNKAPSTPTQVFPTDGLLCTENPLDFLWNASTDTDGDSITYEVQVATDESFSSDLQTKTPSNTSNTFTLLKGIVYYWRVRAKDSKNNFSDYSTVWKYYTEGEGITNHLPFAPTLIHPILNATIIDISTALEWSSTDVDADPLTYDIYFGDTNPPTLIQENISSTSYSVDLSASTTYYWKIVVKDDNGGQAIGQIWSFIAQ